MAVDIVETTRFGFHEQSDGPLRMWEQPTPAGGVV
jgi:hypothetical protein